MSKEAVSELMRAFSSRHEEWINELIADQDRYTFFKRYLPDVQTQGHLWVVSLNGYRVERFSLDAALDEMIKIVKENQDGL